MGNVGETRIQEVLEFPRVSDTPFNYQDNRNKNLNHIWL